MLVCFPHRPGSGGPGSFQSRFEHALIDKGHIVTYIDETNRRPDIVLIVGGSRKLFKLWCLKRSGVPICFRLDGMPWMHRKRWPGVISFFRSELRCILIKFAHAFLADVIIYQSRFVEKWWSRCGWRYRENFAVIPNGVDTEKFKRVEVDQMGTPQEWSPKLICLEGHIDYSPYAVDLINYLADRLAKRGIGVQVFGGFNDEVSVGELSRNVDYQGIVDKEQVSGVYKSAVYLSLDVNAACPNAVIEAMSCAAPIVGFDTGALSELVPEDCGCIVEYSGNPWALDTPDFYPIYEAVLLVLSRLEEMSKNARAHAVNNFQIDNVVQKYLEVFKKQYSNLR